VTPETCSLPSSLALKVKGQRSRSNGTKIYITSTHRSVYIYPDTVPPIHVVSYHVATDKLPSQDGDKFRSIFSDKLQPITTRGKKAHGTLLVDQHCGNGSLIKRAHLSHWGGSRHSQANVSQAAWIPPRSFVRLWVCKRCLLVVVVVVEAVYSEVMKTLWCRLLLRKIAISSIRHTCVH